MDLYQNSASNQGILIAHDMTLPCTCAKLAYLIGNYDNIETIKYYMNKNLVGEMTIDSQFGKCVKDGIIDYFFQEIKNDLDKDELEYFLGKRILPCIAQSSVKYNQTED